jgi:predicted nuclease of predicted toxin-antitoxin system
LSIKFLADASLNPRIARGLRRSEPSIDFQEAKGLIADGTQDLEVLAIAADAGRLLVTTDVTTMPVHLQVFIKSRESPGVILVPSTRSIGQAIEGLLLLWLNRTSDDLRNRAEWLP